MRLLRCLFIVSISLSIVSCQAVQERTNKEAPFQTKQNEGRKEILKKGEEKDDKQSK